MITDSEWENVIEDNHDPELELQWWQDKLQSFKTEIPTAEESKQADEKMKVLEKRNLDKIMFCHWQRFWKRRMQSFEHKLRKINFKDMKN